MAPLLRKYFSTDHKVIGLQYGFTSLFFLLLGFALSASIGDIRPGATTSPRSIG